VKLLLVLLLRLQRRGIRNMRSLVLSWWCHVISRLWVLREATGHILLLHAWLGEGTWHWPLLHAWVIEGSGYGRLLAWL